MSKFIAVPSRTKEILEKYGIRAKKGFGQNFLVDPVIVEKAAKMSHCEGAVIEIGPGIGSLTEQLARHSKHVTAYEIDPSLIPVLADTLQEYDNVEIIEEDFLQADIASKAQELKEKYGSVAVCANLPYYVTTPILFRIFEETDIPWITVMVQKEVGERFAAAPNTPEYGALSVESQYLFDVKKLFNVPGRSFNPSPNVDSVIVRFERKPDIPDIDIKAFFDMVRGCFKQRRKTVYNNLKEYIDDREAALQVLEKAGIGPNRRAQELTCEELLRIYEALK